MIYHLMWNCMHIKGAILVLCMQSSQEQLIQHTTNAADAKIFFMITMRLTSKCSERMENEKTQMNLFQEKKALGTSWQQLG